MRANFAVPEDDRFQVLVGHAEAELVHPDAYLGLCYSSEFVTVQITCNDTRTVEQKKALYAAIADRLIVDPGLRRENILINLVE